MRPDAQDPPDAHDHYGTAAHHELLAVLGGAEDHFERYERAGHLPDLQRALALFQAVLGHARNIDIRSAALNGSGTALWSAYERFGNPDDLDLAVDLFRQALAPYGSEVTVATPSYWTNLSGALRRRWTDRRDIRDLTASIDAIRQALDTTPATGPRRSNRVGRLGDALLALYQAHHDSTALAEAVECFREAVECADAGTEAHTWARSNLAEALRHRHHQVPGGDTAALDEAVDLGRSVVASVSRRHQLYPRFLSNLALLLTDRHQARGDAGDLREAVRWARRAVGATPAGHPSLVHRNATLAGARRLELAAELGRDVTAAREAVVASAGGSRRGGRRPPRRQRRAAREWLRAARQTYAATPDGHVLRGQALLNLGSALVTRSWHENDPNARSEGIGLYRRAALDPAMDASVRVACAHLWALSLIGDAADPWREEYARALEPFRLAVGLLPRTASYRIGRMDRARRLGDFAGLACDAAACALAQGDAESAVELLEQGRGVLLRQALDVRAGTLDAPHRLPAELAAEVDRLLLQLDRPEAGGFTSPAVGGDGGPTPETPLGGEDRHALAEQWERLLDTIRRRPGFADFLRPPRTRDLLAALGDAGPVVLVNVSPLRCDALVLWNGRVRHEPLPHLSHGDAVRRADAFLAAVRAADDPSVPLSRQQDVQREVRKILAWLWTAVAEPVLDALDAGGALTTPSGAPGRVWWVPTGPLTGLPLHAAGRDDGEGAGVLDRVVSSYAPTVLSLTRARRRQDVRGASAERGPERRGPAAPLVVAVPVPPEAGARTLEGARREAERLARRPGSRSLAGERAVRRAVLEALPGHPWVHFACHAVGAADGAPAGHVLLHDHATDPLTAADVARLRLADAELAYLSACGTTRSRRELDDEALHITGAFQMAGFTHVVGTLWSVDDEVSQEVAERFYTAFDTGRVFARDAAHALHDAVRLLRDADESVRPNPTLWAPYIHVGA